MTRKAYPGPIWTAGDDYPVDCLLSEALHWVIFGRQDAPADHQDIDLYERSEQVLSASIRSGKVRLVGRECPGGPYKEIPSLDLVAPFLDWAGSKVWRSGTPPDDKVWLDVRARTDDLLSIAPDPFEEETDEPPESVQEETRQPNGEQDQPSRREQQLAGTAAKYERWFQTSQEKKSERKDGKPLKPIGIAKLVAKKEKEITGIEVNPETIKRRLNEDHPGWAN